jgi:hypothetical protein
MVLQQHNSTNVMILYFVIITVNGRLCDCIKEKCKHGGTSLFLCKNNILEVN